MATFVNPYTFVPFATPARRRPAGHAAMGEGRFSGALEITVTARTPLLIGGFSAEAAAVKDLPKRQDGTVMIPGSGLMGSVRSLHEALTGSCMRIVDIDRVPVHRHPVKKGESERLKPAVVDAVDGDGRAKSVLLCDDWVKIPKALLLSANGTSDDDLPWTGDQLSFEPSEPQKGNALRVRDAEHLEWFAPGEFSGKRTSRMGPITADCWVLLVTDTSARAPFSKTGKPAPVQFAAGRTGPDATRCEIPDPAWADYLKTVEGADDLRTASLKTAGSDEKGDEPRWGTCPPEYADVWWPPKSKSEDTPAGGDNEARPGVRGQAGSEQKIGRRLLARSYLHVGQPVWVQVTGGRVEKIRLSLYWRYLGDGPVGDRIGPARPCTDPENLCWSCRMFGSADTEARGDDDFAVQRSYRGHVRVDDLLAAGTVQPIDWELAPLASPKPGAGQFYLDNSAVPAGTRISERDTKAAATWGSAADQQRPRPLRGRKFYWRTATDANPESAEPARGKRRAHQSKAMSDKVSLIPAGTTFTGRVAFDNLDAAEYGSLLAALDPRLLGGAGENSWEKSVSSVGGGKPFGFGSVTIDVSRVSLETAPQRYLGEPGPEPLSDAAAIEQFTGTAQEAAHISWPSLRHALEFGFIDDAKVWYPPGSGRPGEPDYDKSFEFFARTTGLRLEGDRYRDLVVLPEAAATAARQELDSTAGEHGGPQRRRRQPGGGPR